MHKHQHTHDHSNCPSHSGSATIERDLELLLELLAPNPDMIVLDAATGAGATAKFISSKVKRVIAVDCSESAIQKAQQDLLEHQIDNVELHVTSVENLKFENAAFDAVTCRFATHHLDDLPRALKEMKRVLKPGGRLVIVDSVSPEERELSDFVHRIGKLRDCTFTCVFTLEKWKGIFTDAGFILQDQRCFRETTVIPDWLARSPLNDEEKQRMYQAFQESSHTMRDHFVITFDPVSELAQSYTNEKAVLLAIA